MFIRFIIIFLIFVSKVTAEEISGIPKIIDGDTVHINNYKFRLEGIDAPEMKQQCKKESFKISSTIGFSFYKDYNCGQVSKAKLKAKINGSKIKCISTSKDKYKRYIATCFKGETNLNRWMVRNGHAIAYRKYSKKYVAHEDIAKKDKLGLWSGTFEMPWEYRKKN